MTIVKPIHAREGEAIDIHWHTATEIFVERRTCPPKASREARALTTEDVTPDPTVPGPKLDGIAKE